MSENFTTYTEVDPNARISVTSSKLDVTDMTRSEDAYVYTDKGVGYFAAAFSHDVKVTLTTTDPANSIFLVCCWCVSNIIDDFYGWYSGSSEALVVDFYRNTIQVYETEETNSDSYTGTIEDGIYYLTVERTSETVLDVRIYSDSGRTSLTDTITVAVPTGRRYRHVFGVNSYNDDREAGTFPVIGSLSVEDLVVPLTSYKDTFEANVFTSWTFGSGAWRGTGVDPLSGGGDAVTGEVFRARGVSGEVFAGNVTVGEVF